MLENDGRPPRLRTGRRDGARGREGKDNLSRAIKSTYPKAGQRDYAKPWIALRDGLHDVTHRTNFLFFFSRCLVTSGCLTGGLRERVSRNRWKLNGSR